MIHVNSLCKVITSSVFDGSMKWTAGYPIDENTIANNRRDFLARYDISLENSVRVQLDYDSTDFCRYDIVDISAGGKGMSRDGRIADGLATREKNLALFLPLADCIGVVLCDPKQRVLMVTHLGRHNLEQNGGQKSVEFMTRKFGTNPKNLEAYFSPSAGKENYPLFAFEHKSLAEVASEQLISAGVKRVNIEISPIDTTKDETYFSHSQFLAGNRQLDGRFAVVAMLKN